MEIAELLKNSTIIGIELHACFLVLIILMYWHMRKGFARSNRKSEITLTIVYIGIGLMIIGDCLWSSVSGFGSPGNVPAYIINLIYFLSSSLAAACWFIFCINSLETKLSNSKLLWIITMIPFAAVVVLYVLSPWCGFIFSIQDGEYVRGSLFYFDPVIKAGYVIAVGVLALVYGHRRKHRYLRKKDYSLALFGVPVIICGVLQTITDADFNCLGVTLGLALIYLTGITNPDSENTDVIYSLANSFEASYIVNLDTGLIRPLRQDVMHDMDVPGMTSLDYMSHFNSVLSHILLPEDKENTLATFNIENVAERFRIDNSFSIRYRVKELSGRTAIHTASFIRATGSEGRREFLLGINSISSDSLLYERNEILNNENIKLEQINASIIESVAKIVEVRDGSSGEHVVRVKKLTETLATEVMKEYPEYNLDEKMVKLISSASVLHDIGKIVIPDAILLKPGRFTPEEFEIMKTHSAKGCDILNLFPLGLDDAFLGCALSICRWHHEKYDGRGYPDGLKGEEIPIAAQIVSAADCFDALVSERPYKEAYSHAKALEMITSGECGAFSEKMIHAMEKAWGGDK